MQKTIKKTVDTNLVRPERVRMREILFGDAFAFLALNVIWCVGALFHAFANIAPVDIATNETILKFEEINT